MPLKPGFWLFLLALATIAACALAAMNFEHESGMGVPTDGVLVG